MQTQLDVNKAAAAGNNPNPWPPSGGAWPIVGTVARTWSPVKPVGAQMTPGSPNGATGAPPSPTLASPPAPVGALPLGPTSWTPLAGPMCAPWLAEPKNVARLLKEWEQSEQHAETSLASRLEAANAHLATLCDRMAALADDIETARGEARKVLNEKLDELAAAVQRETAKRDRLLREASAASDRAQDERDIREWVCEVAAQSDGYTRELQRDTLRALGARVVVWRADHVHADGWPQRYRITLTWTGFTGQPVTLPARYPDAHNNLLLPLPVEAHNPGAPGGA